MFLEPDREFRFPNLKRNEYQVTSDETTSYNCIAWAANDSTRWWEPEYYWPVEVTEEISLESLRSVFEQLGYEECGTADFELDFEKIAIYVDDELYPCHAARQLSTGNWTSKLGDWQDIEHETLDALESTPFMKSPYGTVALIMRRHNRSTDLD